MSGNGDRIERLLTLSAEHLFPETPAIHERVVVQLRAREVDLGPARPSRAWRPRLVAALAIVIALAATMTLSSGARQAMADLLGVVGIDISFDDVDTEGLRGPEIDELELGRAVSESEAGTLVGFALRGPGAATRPMEIFFDPTVGEDGMVSTVFEDAEATLLITEFAAKLSVDSLKKLGAIGTHVTIVRVGKTDGYWIEGEPHVFGYLDDRGFVRTESQRLAGDVLLWAAEGITYRIEGAGSLRQALSIAAEMGF